MTNPYDGTPLAGWAEALRESDEVMDETLAAHGHDWKDVGSRYVMVCRCACGEYSGSA